MHPDEAVRPITKIVQSILRDAASLVDPEEGRRTVVTNDKSSSEQKSDSRKAKRARLFESDQVMSGRRRTTPAEAELINHSLSGMSCVFNPKPWSLTRFHVPPPTALHRIILHGAWLFPGSLVNQTIRLLLAYGLSGQFFNAAPDYSANALMSEGLAYCPSIRVRILRCLLATLQTVAKEAHGMLELALSVFRNGLNASVLDETGRQVCAQALGMVDSLLRPVLPPVVKSMALRQATRDLTGGSILGKEVDFVEESEDARSFIDLQEAENQAALQRKTATDLSDYSASGLSHNDQQPFRPIQPTSFPSSAAPSAEEAAMPSFAHFTSQDSTTTPPQDDTSMHLVKSLSTTQTTAETSLLESEPSSKKLAGEMKTRSGSAEKSEEGGGEQEETEPPLGPGGGRQAELAAVNWDAEDSDTSDDDAPMPKIYTTDDE